MEPVEVAELLREFGLPAPDAAAIRPLGSGLQNTAYLAGDLVVRSRLPTPGTVGSAAGSAIAREHRLLDVVAGVSPLRVPEPLALDPARGVLVYRLLPGRPLLGVAAAAPPESLSAIGGQLGGFLRALHGMDLDLVAGLVDLDLPGTDEWRTEAIEDYRAIGDHLTAAQRRAVERFLTADPPDLELTGRRDQPVADPGAPMPAAPLPSGVVFSHNDLGSEHVLVDTGWSVTGIIDWTDAALTDPAVDFGLIARDLGFQALETAFAEYHRPASASLDRERRDGLRTRALFYARCSLLEDLRFGFEHRKPEYLGPGLAAVDRLYGRAA